MASYEEYRGEHNSSVVFNIDNDLVESLNEEFLKLVKNVPHSYEVLLKHVNIGRIMDKNIDYHSSYTVYLNIDMNFVNRFIKRLEVDYVLKERDDLPYPVAYAALRCGGVNVDAFEDYMNLEHVH